MTPMLDGKNATIDEIHRAFDTKNIAPLWRSSMASFYTMPELTNWVTQGLNRLGVNADRVKLSLTNGSAPDGRQYYTVLLFWLG